MTSSNTSDVRQRFYTNQINLLIHTQRTSIHEVAQILDVEPEWLNNILARRTECTDSRLHRLHNTLRDHFYGKPAAPSADVPASDTDDTTAAASM
jgi:hypothetical protein